MPLWPKNIDIEKVMIPVISLSKNTRYTKAEKAPTFDKSSLQSRVKEYLSNTADYKSKFHKTYLQKFNESSNKS